jgi:hypothetical protein
VFHVLTLTYTPPLDVVDASRPAHLVWLQQEVNAGDPCSLAGVVAYERVSINAGVRAPGL